VQRLPVPGPETQKERSREWGKKKEKWLRLNYGGEGKHRRKEREKEREKVTPLTASRAGNQPRSCVLDVWEKGKGWETSSDQHYHNTETTEGTKIPVLKGA